MTSKTLLLSSVIFLKISKNMCKYSKIIQYDEQVYVELHTFCCSSSSSCAVEKNRREDDASEAFC